MKVSVIPHSSRWLNMIWIGSPSFFSPGWGQAVLGWSLARQPVWKWAVLFGLRSFACALLGFVQVSVVLSGLDQTSLVISGSSTTLFWKQEYHLAPMITPSLKFSLLGFYDTLLPWILFYFFDCPFKTPLDISFPLPSHYFYFESIYWINSAYMCLRKVFNEK